MEHKILHNHMLNYGNTGVVKETNTGKVENLHSACTHVVWIPSPMNH